MNRNRQTRRRSPGCPQERAARFRAEAEGLKEAANSKFQERQFHESIKLYSKAIAVQPGVATFYGAAQETA